MERYVVFVIVVVALTSGCTVNTQSTIEPTSNATLSLSGYERTGGASSVENRTFWDRSKTWENPGNQTAVVTSRANAYRSSNSTDTVIVFTTPKKKYVGADSVRSLSAPDLASLATRGVKTPSLGNHSGPTFQSSLFDRQVSVWTLTDPGDDTTGYVTRVVHKETIVVVVVAGGADRATVELVLGGVVPYNSSRVDR